MTAKNSNKYDIQNLLYLMQRLRDPNTGCPWDHRQTFTSLIKYTIEEVYEVADAIAQGESEPLCEELGDLLFQVIFYAQIAQENKAFQFDDIVHQLVSKMIRRHPHVFPDGSLESVVSPDQRPTELEIKQQWQKIKSAEAEMKFNSTEIATTEIATNQDFLPPIKQSILDDISHKIPALQTAEKIQRKVALVGFDWSSWKEVLDKIKEEVSEVEEAMNQTIDSDYVNRESVKEEIGDLLFTCVNLARHCDLDSENLLRSANLKFEQRFRKMEIILSETGKEIASQSAEELEELWQRVKKSMS